MADKRRPIVNWHRQASRFIPWAERLAYDVTQSIAKERERKLRKAEPVVPRLVGQIMRTQRSQIPQRSR